MNAQPPRPRRPRAFTQAPPVTFDVSPKLKTRREDENQVTAAAMNFPPVATPGGLTSHEPAPPTWQSSGQPEENSAGPRHPALGL